MFDVITLILFSTIQFIWSIPLILLNIIGIQLYKVTDTSEINTILNKLKPYLYFVENRILYLKIIECIKERKLLKAIENIFSYIFIS